MESPTCRGNHAPGKDKFPTQFSELTNLDLCIVMSSQIINGDDIEQRAFACVTFARCMIAASPEPQGHFPTFTEQFKARLTGRTLIHLQVMGYDNACRI